MLRFTAILALFAMALSIWSLERARAGLHVTPLIVPGGTPATLYLRPGDEPAPVVVIAHGFAGSRQLMDSYALTLAHAGYLAVSFDFEGHGRNPRPMSGDIGSVSGTTQLLMTETARVARAALTHPRADGRLAYLGHSMASDIIARQSALDPPVDVVVAVSMFSGSVSAQAPANLLVIAGQWETRLAQEALRTVQQIDPNARIGQTLGDPATGPARRAVIAPRVEHVGVLFSATALRETRDWLDASFGRTSEGPVPQRGGWIAVLLIATVALGWPLARVLPAGPSRTDTLSGRGFVAIALVPAAVVPLILWPVDTNLLPVLVADYLALHLGLYGMLTLTLLAWQGQLKGQFPLRVWWIAAGVAVFGILAVGGVIERHVTSFVPHPGRLAVIGGLALGAVPFMLGDALLTGGGTGRLWRVLVARGAFLMSLALAVALDLSGLFFLIVILPVIVLFFMLFGTMAGWVGRRTGLPAAAGIGLGLVLAWALGVTFPMFDAGLTG